MDLRKKKIIILSGSLFVAAILLYATFATTDEIVPEQGNVPLRIDASSDITIDDMMATNEKRVKVQDRRESPAFANGSSLSSDIDNPQDIQRVQALIRESEENVNSSLRNIEADKHERPLERVQHPSVGKTDHFEGVTKPVDCPGNDRNDDDTIAVSVSSSQSTSPFNSLKLRDNSTKNAIKAYVHSEQVVTEGSTLKLRLGERAYTDNGVLIPKNSPVYGVVTSIDGERVQVRVTSVNVNGNILPFAKSVYSKDALLGIYVPGNPKADASKEVTAGALDGLPVTGLAGVDAAARIAGVVASSAANAGKQVLSQNIKKIKVTIKTNYEVYLRPDQK